MNVVVPTLYIVTAPKGVIVATLVLLLVYVI